MLKVLIKQKQIQKGDTDTTERTFTFAYKSDLNQHFIKNVLFNLVESRSSGVRVRVRVRPMNKAYEQIT